MPESRLIPCLRPRHIPILFLIALTFASAATAHFLLNLNVRIIHVEHVEDGLRVYIRTPMPYLVADKLGEIGSDELPEAAPFTSNTELENQVVHYVDFDAVSRTPNGLGYILEDGLRLHAFGERLSGRVENTRIHRVGREPGFATLLEAKAALLLESLAAPPLFVGDAIVDVEILYISKDPTGSYSVASTLDPGLPDQELTANLVIDYDGDAPRVFRARGLLDVPIEIGPSVSAAFLTFVVEGIRHILEGVDHVLFVICLVIGARSLNDLLCRVTGFTLGHSVTLALGFFGFVPSGAWFVPTIETGVALSIVYAAWSASFGFSNHQRRQTTMVAVTMLIGLFHGLGFSFVLQEILQVTSPNIWSSLLAFNIGVEIGQLLIVVTAWPLLHFLVRFNVRSAQYARWGISALCAAVACLWAVERAVQALSTLA